MSTLASLAVQITGNISGLSSALQTAQGQLNGFAGGVEQISAQMRATGTKLSVGVTAPLVGVGATALTAAADFEQSMNVMQQVSGATGAQMEAMQAQALQLGAQTSFSAGEAAQGMLELAKAGMSAEQSSAAIGGVLSLAAAGGLSVASSAEIAANALNSFGLEASAMPMVADLMAAAANSSSIEIGDMAAAFQMSSAVFASNSQGIDDLSTAIAILGNNGLKGSDAGTSLKTMLMSLTAPTDAAAADMAALGVSVYDAQGNMRAMPSIMADLENGLSGLTQQQQNAALTTIFGADAIRAANILLKAGATGWEEMADSLGEQGAAASVANARMKGLGGALEYLKGSIESTLIGAALPWTEMLGNMLRWVGDLVSGFGTLSPTVQQIAVVLGVAAAAAGPLLIGISMMLPALGLLGGVLAALVSPLGLVAAGFAAVIALDIGGIGTMLGDLGRYFAAVVEDGDYLNDWLTHFPEWMQPAVEWIGKLTAAVVALAQGGSFDDFLAAADELTGLDISGWVAGFTAAWEDVQTAVGDAVAFVSERWTALQDAFASGDTSWSEMFGEIGAQLTGVGTAADGAMPAVASFVEALTGSEDAAATVVGALGSIGAAVSPVVTALTDAQAAVDTFTASEAWTTASSEIGTALGNIGTAISGAVTGDIDFGTLQATITTQLSGIGTAISELFQSEAFTQLSGELSAALGLDAAAAAIAPQVEAIKAAIQPLIDFLSPAFERLSTTVSGLGDYFSNIGTQIEPVKTALGELVAVFEPVATVISGLFSGGDSGSSPSAAAKGLAAALSLMLNVVNGLAAAIEPLVSGVLAELATVLSGLATIVGGLTTAFGGMISGDTAAVWAGLGTAAQGVADILTGTLQNALGVISGLLTALGTTITGTLSDWGFGAAAASVQGVIDNVTALIDWLGQLAAGEVSIGAVMPEWIANLLAWRWPVWTAPDWLTTLTTWVPTWTAPEWLTALFSWTPTWIAPEWWTALTTWTWPEWTMPTWLTVLTLWQWPDVTMPEWINRLLAWAWPGFPSAPSWVTSLMAWIWPTLESVQWVLDLLAWAWPGLPGADWIGTLLTWNWPTIPGAGWIEDLLNWDWPGLPSLPSWLGGGNDTTAETTGNNASGTPFWRGGLTWVGESGRELVQLPRGSAIYSNRESERMAASGAQVTVYATVQSDIDMETLAWRVVDLIGARA